LLLILVITYCLLLFSACGRNEPEEYIDNDQPHKYQITYIGTYCMGMTV